MEEVFRLWESMGKARDRIVVSYNIFIKGLFENGKVKDANLVWESLQKDYKCHPDSVVREWVYQRCIAGSEGLSRK